MILLYEWQAKKYLRDTLWNLNFRFLNEKVYED